MKKFKSILCITFAFILTAIVLCACGINNKENQEVVGTKTTISLAEAERIIVKALAIDNKLSTQSTRGMVLHTADASEGNRDILEKLGRFVCNIESINTSINSSQIIKFNNYYQAFYKNNNFQSCLFNSKINGVFDMQGYYEHKCYIKRDTGIQELGTITDDNNVNTQFSIIKTLFADEAFDSVYDDKATKETNKDGYSITLTGDYKSAARYIYITSFSKLENADFESYWESYQEHIKDCSEYFDKCHFNVTVNVDDSNSVISATADLTQIVDDDVDHTLQNTIITLTKTNEPIVEPDWVTEYKNKINNQ